MKCDETQPICINCKISDRGSQCIYINIGRTSPSETSSLPVTPSPFDSSSFLSLSTSTSHTADGSTVSNPAPSNNTLGPGDLFDLSHLALYHHLLMNRFVITLTDPTHENIVDYVFEYAFQAPYLMNQLLALAALHLSKPPLGQQPYYQLATSLQTRALASFNQERQEISDDTCIPIFLFTSLVGLHVLCDTLQGPRETSHAFFDRFISYLLIHRGVRAVTTQTWKTLRNSRFGPLFQRIQDASTTSESNAEPPIDILNKMIEANASPSSANKYRNVISALQRSFTLHKSLEGSSGGQLNAIVAFCLDFNDEYLHLLRQRQPEALVILAFFAVLLHWNRRFWVIGDGGQFLIRSIADDLGQYWAKWLQWPISALEDVS